MRQALLILAKSMILGAGSSVLFALGLHLVISEHWALDRIGRNHVDTWITVAIVWFFTLARIPHLAQTSDAVNRQLSCFSSRYMNLLAVFQI